MQILTEIKNSIYNPNFYKSLLPDKTLGASIKYLVKLALLVALVGVIIFSFKVPNTVREIKSFVTSLAENYPDDLVISSNGKEATTNKNEPYKIPMGQEESRSINTYLNLENFLVVDTTKSFSPEDFRAHSSFVWLTKTELVMMKSERSNQIQITPLSSLDKWEVDKSWILDKETKFLKMLKWLIPALVVFAYLLFFLGIFSGTLISLFLYALIVWLMHKLKKIKFSYKDSYRIGLHAITLIILVDFLSKHLGIPNNLIINLIIFVIVVYVNVFKDSPEKQVVDGSANETPLKGTL